MRLPFFGKHEGNFSRKDDKTELFFKTSCRLTAISYPVEHYSSSKNPH